MNHGNVIHIERTLVGDYHVGILDPDGELLQDLGNTTLANLEAAGYNSSFLTEMEKSREFTVYATEEGFKKALERASRRSAVVKESLAKSDKAKKRTSIRKLVEDKLAGMSEEEIERFLS